MVEVVARLPVVEDFVTILDGREDGGNEVGCGKYEESYGRRELRPSCCMTGLLAYCVLGQVVYAHFTGGRCFWRVADMAEKRELGFVALHRTVTATRLSAPMEHLHLKQFDYVQTRRPGRMTISRS